MSQVADSTGSIVISDSNFTSNYASGGGGAMSWSALRTWSATVVIDSCSFQSNIMNSFLGGGAILFYFPKLSESISIAASTFISNIAHGLAAAVVSGGAIYLVCGSGFFSSSDTVPYRAVSCSDGH